MKKSFIGANYLALLFPVLLLFGNIGQNGFLLHAQPTITASLNAYDGLIGDQFQLNITAEYDTHTTLELPTITEVAVDSLEILNVGEVSIESLDNITKATQIYTLTGFEARTYTIRKVGVRFKSDNGQTGIIQTEPVTLTITEPEIDPEGGAKPNKTNLDVPLTFKEMLPYIVVGIIILVLITFLIRHFLKKRQQQVEDIFISPPPPPRPAHETALAALDQLAKAELWQQGKIKSYYSELTDIARHYIEHRYEIPALESTTDELMSAFKQTNVSAKNLQPLKNILNMADLVKFAKAKPTIDQHNSSFKVIEQFVLQTKLVKPLFEEETVES
ncbi:MAG: hypothetical protein ACPGXL_01110 [Chitinophagales bacterium]